MWAGDFPGLNFPGVSKKEVQDGLFSSACPAVEPNKKGRARLKRNLQPNITSEVRCFITMGIF